MFNIIAIHNNQSKTFLAAMVSVLPSASIYENKRRPGDAAMFYQPDYNSGHAHY